MLHINLICYASRYSYVPTVNWIATVEFQDSQSIAREYNYYKYILWALNLLQNLITYMC